MIILEFWYQGLRGCYLAKMWWDDKCDSVATPYMCNRFDWDYSRIGYSYLPPIEGLS